jgi:hypothetical protein
METPAENTEKTPERQTAAIASVMPKGFLEGLRWNHKGQWILFNPLNDLNAMHEAEKVLTEKQVRSYAFTLAQVLDTSPTVDLDDQFLNIHATAAQRVEAFLRTLNLWNPTP